MTKNLFKIAVVSDSGSWIQPYLLPMLDSWTTAGHSASLMGTPTHEPVDIRFLLSYSRIVVRDVRETARSNVVVHGSALPHGKGWSPWSWSILEGRNDLTLTLFEAVDGVDSGAIYIQRQVHLAGHELSDEWQAIQARTIVEMCNLFVAKFPDVLAAGMEQEGEETFYPRRRPDDSRLDPDRSLRAQFNLLRIVDNERYPAFFEYSGKTYEIRITKRQA